jgi:hypothetical protein
MRRKKCLKQPKRFGIEPDNSKAIALPEVGIVKTLDSWLGIATKFTDLINQWLKIVLTLYGVLARHDILKFINELWLMVSSK